MKTRKYRDTREFIPLLGFGCMRLPRISEESQEVDYDKGKKMVDYAMEHGVNYFDTAYGYHAGLSERFLRKALASYARETYFLADKFPIWMCTSEEDVLRIFQEQLERCGVEYFDYYLLHNIMRENLPLIDTYHIYDQLADLKSQGKIRRLGFSFHDVPEILEKIVNRYEWDFAQIQLNYLDWEEQDAKHQYEILTEKGIPVIVMEPLRGGTLTALEGEAAEILQKTNPNYSQASWGLRFAASLPGVLTVLSGMSEPEQVHDNISVMEQFIPLTTDEFQVLKEVIAASKLNSAIPCTACRYCMDCPAGVDIPRIFSAYSHYLMGYKGMTNSWGDEVNFMKDYRLIGTEKQAHNCVSCDDCSQKCPQKINIPELMQTITAFAEEAEEVQSRMMNIATP